MTRLAASAAIAGVCGVTAACGGSQATTATAPTSAPTTVFTVPETLPARTATAETPATTSTPPAATAPQPAAEAEPAARVPRPPIVADLIPFPLRRKQEMAAYAERHYGVSSYVLSAPKVIVEHIAVAPSAASVKATFTPDNPDPELGELPQVCAHFVVDSDGTIHQLVPLDVMCRHTVGLNDVAIGIEHAGSTDQDLLGNEAELRASLRLTAWLRCRFGISIRNVIGHNESLSSPFHHENVPALRSQTHGDMTAASMQTYRARLARIAC